MQANTNSQFQCNCMSFEILILFSKISNLNSTMSSFSSLSLLTGINNCWTSILPVVQWWCPMIVSQYLFPFWQLPVLHHNFDIIINYMAWSRTSSNIPRPVGLNYYRGGRGVTSCTSIPCRISYLENFLGITFGHQTIGLSSSPHQNPEFIHWNFADFSS